MKKLLVALLVLSSHAIFAEEARVDFEQEITREAQQIQQTYQQSLHLQNNISFKEYLGKNLLECVTEKRIYELQNPSLQKQAGGCYAQMLLINSQKGLFNKDEFSELIVKGVQLAQEQFDKENVPTLDFDEIYTRAVLLPTLEERQRQQEQQQQTYEAQREE